LRRSRRLSDLAAGHEKSVSGMTRGTRNVASQAGRRESPGKPLYGRRRIRLIGSMHEPAESFIGFERAAADPPAPADAATRDAPVASCDYCGSARLEWRKCKLVCEDCKQINKSCADL
jgi:hypothetical protein